MGIGNFGTSVRPTSRLIISLPLMGIGNTHRQPKSATSRTSHYPSWGLGTTATACAGRPLFLLITPHGDWELCHLHVLASVGICSLPLMGIWNPLAQGQSSARRSPHYPSWGLGTHIRRVLAHHVFGSLPLMGIGNRACCRPYRPRQCAHYPSWGLGTCERES